MTLQRAHTHTRTHPLHSHTHSRSWAQFPFPLGFVMFPDTSFVGCRSSTPFIHNCRMHLFKPPSLPLSLPFSLCLLLSFSLSLHTLGSALANIKEILELTLKKYLHCVAALGRQLHTLPLSREWAWREMIKALKLF